MKNWPADKVERRKVSALLPYARNARTHSPEQVAQIARSITEFGFTNPVLVDETGTIIAGHGRVLAAKKLALADVPVIVADGWTEAQKRAYVIADNKLAENAGWDMSLLRMEIGELKSMDFDLSLTGFDPSGIASLLNTTDGETDPDDVPEESTGPATARRGDVWTLGRHRLMCGDSTSAEDVAALFDGRDADVCFTSPPYGVAPSANLRDHYVAGAKKRKTFYDDHDDDPAMWSSLMRGWFGVARSRCRLVVCNVQMLAANKLALIEWIAEIAGDLIDVAVWDKGHAAPQMQRNVMNACFEFLLMFGGNGSRSIPFGDFHGTVENIVRIDPKKSKNEFAGVHRAVMPTELPVWVIDKLSSACKSVFDPFSGSGTTIIAAEMTGRDALAMEISPGYVDVAIKRWQAFAGKEATLDGVPFAAVAAQRAEVAA